MKIILKFSFIIISFFCIFNRVYAQDIPSWVRYGLTEKQIKEILGVKSTPETIMFEGKSAIWGGENKDKKNIHQLVVGGNLYNFDIDPQKGLTVFFIVGDYNALSIIKDFTYKYGQPYIKMMPFFG